MFTVLDTSNDLAKSLLIHYGFDLSGYSSSELIARWKSQYPLNWLHLAVIEALYQGRYKAISVQQILALWQRRGQATFHFNVEFESLICRWFPEKFTASSRQLKLNKFPKSPQKQINHLSSVPNNQVHEQQEAETTKNQESTEEIPRFLRLAQRHRHSASNHTDNDSSHIDNQLTSPGLESKSVNYTGNEVLEQVIKQSAFTTTTATLTAIETTIEVTRSPGTSRLGHFETSHPNHPPIDQFTPEHSVRSDCFASKLKAISTRQLAEA